LTLREIVLKKATRPGQVEHDAFDGPGRSPIRSQEEAGLDRWWIPHLGNGHGPVYKALATAITDAVRSGALSGGDRLPPHRLMAEQLGVDVATVTRAYREAHRAGLLEATVGRGTFIRRDAALVHQRHSKQAMVDLSMNLPPLPAEAAFGQMLRTGIDRLLRDGDLSSLMTYHGNTANVTERRAGASWLRPCLGMVEPHRVLVAPGAQSALLAVINAYACPGDIVLCERLTYPGLKALAAQLGIILAGVQTDEEGLLPDALERSCRELQPRLIYCTPTIQNPTTSTMSLTRRQAVVDIARAYGVPILEDDAYGLLPATPLPALAQLAPDLVFYVATTAKTLSPGLRLAHLVAPGREESERLTTSLRGMVQMSSGLLGALVAGWIESGDAHAMLSAIRTESAARQEIARETLTDASFSAHPQGPHLWLRLPPGWTSRQFVRYARAEQLALVPADQFLVEAVEDAPAVRVALGAAASRDRLREQLRRLNGFLGRSPPPPIFS